MDAVKNAARSVEIFRRFLRIKTVHPNPDYEGAVNFLRVYAQEAGLEFGNTEPYPGNPFAWMTWRGQDSTLPSILLYSHMDVVPVYQDHWKHDPFEAFKDDQGKIHGRGTQDMKSVAIQYVEAIRNLKESETTCLRDVHVVFAPDEELGGEHGMAKFVQHEAFKNFNVAVMMDEGITTDDDIYRIYYGEKVGIPLIVQCSGNTGHGSKFVENTAAEKMRKIVNTVLSFRDEEKSKLANNSSLTLGDVITVNLTQIEGGVHVSTVPSCIELNFDLRVPPTTDFEKFAHVVNCWMKNAGPGVSYKLDFSHAFRNITDLQKASLWWSAICRCFKNLDVKFKKEIFPAGTDSKHARKLGYPCFGFSPIIKTPVLLHDHNEFLHQETFLEGIRIYMRLIPELANAQ